MAQSDRFYFWRAFYDALLMLDTDAQRGEFVRGMCQWAFDGEMPDFSDKMLSFGFTNIRDQLSESVNIGRVARETGSQGGRPRKTVPKTVPKTTPKTVPKTVPETVPETEGKGTDQKGSDLDSASAESGASRNAPYGAALAPTPAADDGVTIPPKPDGWE